MKIFLFPPPTPHSHVWISIEGGDGRVSIEGGDGRGNTFIIAIIFIFQFNSIIFLLCSIKAIWNQICLMNL